MPRPNKYHATPTEYGGVRYASKAEASRAMELDLLLAGGAIRGIVRQPTFRLGADFRYRADFLVIDQDGSEHAEDVKGVQTQRFRMCCRLWKKYGIMPLVILRSTRSGWERTVIDPIGTRHE